MLYEDLSLEVHEREHRIVKEGFLSSPVILVAHIWYYRLIVVVILEMLSFFAVERDAGAEALDFSSDRVRVEVKNYSHWLINELSIKVILTVLDYFLEVSEDWTLEIYVTLIGLTVEYIPLMRASFSFLSLTTFLWLSAKKFWIWWEHTNLLLIYFRYFDNLKQKLLRSLISYLLLHCVTCGSIIRFKLYLDSLSFP